MAPVLSLAVVAASLSLAVAASDMVPRCKLGGSDVMVSCVMMGSLHLHEAGSPAGALDKINAALAIGLTTWDTSDVYNSMPELFGAALQLQPGLRERVEVRARERARTRAPARAQRSAAALRAVVASQQLEEDAPDDPLLSTP